MGVGLFLLLCSLPAIGTILRQADEAIPGLGQSVHLLAAYTDQIPRDLVRNTITRHRELMAVGRALSSLSEANANPRLLDSCRRDDPGNGLYDCLGLLLVLRSGEGNDAAVLAQLARFASAPPVQARILRQHQIIEEALGPVCASPRRATLLAWEGCTWLQQSCDKAIRELARLLSAKASAWREAGRTTDATRAHAAIIRLATDLAKESPSPGTMLLASELTASTCRKLARDYAANGAGPRPASGPATVGGSSSSGVDPRAFEEAASKAAALRDTWHGIVDTEGVGVLPWMGASIHILLARPEHHRVMVSLVCSLLALTCCATLLALLVPVGIAAVVARMPPDVELKWRGGQGGRWGAAALPVLPLLVMLAYLSLANVDFTWLLSAPSALGLAGFPSLMVVLVWLAAYGFAVVTEKEPRYGWSLGGVKLVAGGLVTGIVPIHCLGGVHSSWWPPRMVSELRVTGLIALAGCLVLVALWVLINVLRRVAGRFSLAVLARAFLPVIAAGFLYMSLLAFSLLWLNDARNTAHQQAFARAAADPVADRLGPNWYQDHLAGARALVETLESR